MREELAQREGLRGRFTATFARRGRKRGFDDRAPVATALFVNVRDEAGQLSPIISGSPPVCRYRRLISGRKTRSSLRRA